MHIQVKKEKDKSEEKERLYMLFCLRRIGGELAKIEKEQK